VTYIICCYSLSQSILFRGQDIMNLQMLIYTTKHCYHKYLCCFNYYVHSLTCFQVFSSMDTLRVLTLTGNPVIKKISHYRNVLILECVSTALLRSY
jgi:hypothetical protein